MPGEAEFTYDPTMIMDKGLNQMRFELGDVDVSGAEQTAFISDQEIVAVCKTNKSWKRKKYYLAANVLARLAYEANTSISGLSISYSQRFNHWKELTARLKKEAEQEEMLPTMKTLESADKMSDTPYFYEDMHKNF